MKTGFAVHSSRVTFLLLAAGILTALVAVLVESWTVNNGDHVGANDDMAHPAHPPRQASGMPRDVLPTVAAGEALAAIGPVLSVTPEAANDVVFLTVAAAYGRCAPAHAHEFGIMAARARLPVLVGLTGILGPHTGSRAALLAGIRELAARMPCEGPADLSIGSFRQRITIQTYAMSFPDSYFEPSLQFAPVEFAGRSLAERANDECNGVAYAVLPLDVPRPWQCAGLRSDARRRVVALCGSGDFADTAARQIHDAVARLPSTCQ